MSEAPERIWAWPNHDERGWYAGGCSYDINFGLDGAVSDAQSNYVRADLLAALEARVKELEAEKAKAVRLLTAAVHGPWLPVHLEEALSITAAD